MAKGLGIVAGWTGMPLTPKAFARAMWPDSPGWKSLTKCGNNGVTRGGAMPQAAGTLLGRLNRAGLINYRHEIMPAGRAALAAYNRTS